MGRGEGARPLRRRPQTLTRRDADARVRPWTASSTPREQRIGLSFHEFRLSPRAGRVGSKIEQHPSLELFSFEVGPALSEKEIEEAEASFGTRLPAPLRQLYRTLGSATLQWCFTAGLDAQRRRLISEHHPDLIPDHSLFDGSIGIASLEDMLFNDEFTPPQVESGETVDFAGVDDDTDELSRMVRHFDAMDDWFAMSFIVQPERADRKMMLFGDHWIEHDHSRVTYLENYLRYVIATWGLVEARRGLFEEYRGDPLEPLRYSPEIAAAHIPTTLTATQPPVR
ncbi:SMI1/KNR4 family protein [Actinomadura chokoriensis]|uniref:SMI1/KNR4 family protein n=1 Tax=Actinomadura chokoriensis TaxID=454156 RepID=A0ABV4R578_9ACTN